MLARSYIAWAANATALDRAEATIRLADVYLYASLSIEDLVETEAALTLALDDPSPLIRRALAEAFAAHPGAPRTIVSALAGDQSDVGAIVLARSPLLSDAELVDCAALGDALSQVAIATRPSLSAPVCAAVAEIGCAEALITLLRNRSADIPAFSFSRMLDRHGEEGRVRDAMLDRPGLDIELRHRLTRLCAQRLQDWAGGGHWLTGPRAERLLSDATSAATLSIATAASDGELPRLVAYLRREGELTPMLLLRALLCGDHRLIVAAMADLTGLPLGRIEAMTFGRGGLGFPALYARAKLPPVLGAAFRAALDAARRETREIVPRLRVPVIEAALASCAADETGPDQLQLQALLTRLHVEASREEARVITAAIMAGAAPLEMRALEGPPPAAALPAPDLSPANDEPTVEEPVSADCGWTLRAVAADEDGLPDGATGDFTGEVAAKAA